MVAGCITYGCSLRGVELEQELREELAAHPPHGAPLPKDRLAAHRVGGEVGGGTERVEKIDWQRIVWGGGGGR